MAPDLPRLDLVQGTLDLLIDAAPVGSPHISEKQGVGGEYGVRLSVDGVQNVDENRD